MEGQAADFLSSWHVTRRAEPSRLQLEHVRRAFELLVSNSRHSVARVDGAIGTQLPAAPVSPVAASGG